MGNAFIIDFQQKLYPRQKVEHQNNKTVLKMYF